MSDWESPACVSFHDKINLIRWYCNGYHLFGLGKAKIFLFQLTESCVHFVGTHCMMAFPSTSYGMPWHGHCFCTANTLLLGSTILCEVISPKRVYSHVCVCAWFQSFLWWFYLRLGASNRCLDSRKILRVTSCGLRCMTLAPKLIAFWKVSFTWFDEEALKDDSGGWCMMFLLDFDWLTPSLRVGLVWRYKIYNQLVRWCSAHAQYSTVLSAFCGLNIVSQEYSSNLLRC